MKRSILALHFQRTHGYKLSEHVDRVGEEKRCSMLGIAWPGNDFQESNERELDSRWRYVPQRHFGEENPHNLTGREVASRNAVRERRDVLAAQEPPAMPLFESEPRELENMGYHIPPIPVQGRTLAVGRGTMALLAMAAVLGGGMSMGRRR